MNLLSRAGGRIAAFALRRRRTLLALFLCSALPLGTAAFAVAAFPTSEPVARTFVWLFGAEYLGRQGVAIQHGADDCGIAALQMVLGPRGVLPSSLDSARAAILGRGEGASMLELKQLAEARGVRAEGWRMRLRELARSPLPAIVHLEDHFAVVDRVLRDGRVEMRDPSLGRIRVSREDFVDLWTGNVLIFPPPGAPRPTPASPSSTAPSAPAAR